MALARRQADKQEHSNRHWACDEGSGTGQYTEQCWELQAAAVALNAHPPPSPEAARHTADANTQGIRGSDTTRKHMPKGHTVYLCTLATPPQTPIGTDWR